MNNDKLMEEVARMVKVSKESVDADNVVNTPLVVD